MPKDSNGEKHPVDAIRNAVMQVERTVSMRRTQTG
jgi:hypothetical protein